uniref:Peptidase M20 dimerisation domain-containing protein n=1 Tax=Oncorhynchus mykiss TaxID=8022 RepID=A0A8K9WQF9_ONCMY
MLEPLFQYIDDHQNQFVQRLKEWVAVQSDSGDHTKWGEVESILNMTAVRIQEMGGTVEFADTVPLPPVILAEFERDPKKATLCIYGHVDVQPAKMADGWTTDPFNLTEIKGNLYGQGATDNKGPVLASCCGEILVNIKLIIEGLEEVGSYGLLELTRKRNDSFFADVDFIVISDNVWATRTPALTYGTRGSRYFFVEVDCPKLDFHPGVYGGSIQEPMSDQIALLGSLLDHTGKILVPGLYDNISFDLEEMKSVTGVKHFLQDTKCDYLFWDTPYLSYITWGSRAFSEPSTKTVIPKQVTGKFSIRQVPNMDPPDVERKVKEHLQQIFSTLKSPNRLRVTTTVGAKPWVANLKDPLCIDGQRAVREEEMEPELIREGSTIPIALNFQEETGKSVMMLPIGGHDDGEHSQNEKISRYNYIEGTKLLADYFDEISLLQKVQDIFPSKL